MFFFSRDREREIEFYTTAVWIHICIWSYDISTAVEPSPFGAVVEYWLMIYTLKQSQCFNWFCQSFYIYSTFKIPYTDSKTTDGVLVFKSQILHLKLNDASAMFHNPQWKVFNSPAVIKCAPWWSFLVCMWKYTRI